MPTPKDPRVTNISLLAAPSLILPLSTAVTEEGEKQGARLLTKGWVTLGKTLGSSESSVSSERLCECEASYPRINDPLSEMASGSTHFISSSQMLYVQQGTSFHSSLSHLICKMGVLTPASRALSWNSLLVAGQVLCQLQPLAQ